MSVQPGSTFGRYQIIAPLGTGGMATVYKAFHPGLDRTVAIKVIRTGFTDDPDFLERFRQEARAVARLRHPNIVQVFDFDEADGQHFIVMEHLEGGTLKQRLRALEQSGQRLPRRETLRIVSEIAEGLAYAHQSGILHRDVKPANVLLTRDGRAVVTDFGIARMVMSTELTRTGVGVGTPEYMSPEQARGEGVDQRADIYSLGVIAFELITGRVPFTADTPLAVILKHLNDPLPAPSSIDPQVGEATERVLMRVLSKDPFDRHASATELAQALGEAFAEDERDRTSTFARAPIVAPPSPAVAAPAAAPPRARPAWMLPAAIVIAAGVVTAGIAVATSVGAPRPSTLPSPTAAATEAPRTGPAALVAGPQSGRFDPAFVRSGQLTRSAGGSAGGPVTSEFAPGAGIGIVLELVQAPLRVEYVRSVGPITVDHPLGRPFAERTGFVDSCCYVAPAQPGSYKLTIGANGGKVVAEIPYTVR